MLDTSNWKEFRMANIFDIEHVKKFTLPNKPYVMDGDIISSDGTNPYIAAISTNNGIKGYSNYGVNNEGDCITLSTTADSSNTVFYQKNAFIGRQQIAGIRRKDGTMGEHCGLFIVSVLKPLLRLFNYGNKLTIDYLRDLYIMLPSTPSGEPDWDFMEQYIAELEEERVAELEAYLISTGLDSFELTEEDKEVLSKDPEWEEFRIGDLFNIKTTKSFDKKNLSFKDNGDCDFIGRSSTDNGIQGKLNKLDIEPNQANCFSLIQIGENIAIWRDRPWYASQNLFKLVPKHKEIETANLYFKSAIDVAMKKYGNDVYASYPTLKSLQSDIIKLPVRPNGRPDFEYMEKYIRAIEKLTIQGVVEWKDKEIEETRKLTA